MLCIRYFDEWLLNLAKPLSFIFHGLSRSISEFNLTKVTMHSNKSYCVGGQ